MPSWRAAYCIASFFSLFSVTGAGAAIPGCATALLAGPPPVSASPMPTGMDEGPDGATRPIDLHVHACVWAHRGGGGVGGCPHCGPDGPTHPIDLRLHACLWLDWAGAQQCGRMPTPWAFACMGAGLGSVALGSVGHCPRHEHTRARSRVGTYGHRGIVRGGLACSVLVRRDT
eukprot:352171-Chlamydomonas_euryale.AAC.7